MKVSHKAWPKYWRILMLFASIWFWMSGSLVSLLRTWLILYLHMDFPVMLLGSGPEMSMLMNSAVLRLERAELFVCAFPGIDFGRMSNISVQVCVQIFCPGHPTNVLSYRLIRPILPVVSCTCVVVRQVENGGTYFDVDKILKGAGNWCFPYNDIIAVEEAAWGEESDYMYGGLKFVVCSCSLDKFFQSWRFLPLLYENHFLATSLLLLLNIVAVYCPWCT